MHSSLATDDHVLDPIGFDTGELDAADYNQVVDCGALQGVCFLA